MNYAALVNAVEQDAALRRKQTLQPVGGKGDKIFPPTYPEERRGQGPRHVFERRQINGEEVWCVLVDSVQSQANRLEESLLAAVRDEKKPLALPYVTVDFHESGLSGLVEITSLEAPHRVYDAILRDSSLNDQPFMKSPLGKSLAEAKPANATALLQASPTALLFGVWHSTGEGGGLGAKFPRCLVSEIIAINVPANPIKDHDTGRILEVQNLSNRTGSRIDPVGILKDVRIYQSKEDPRDWTPDKNQAATKKDEPILFSRKKSDKAGKPSVINHGNVTPSVEPLGITCDHIEHIVVLSFAGLRRLSFGKGERDRAGRALLAALGIVALTEQDARGYALRSRCDLVCEGRAPLELVHADGKADTIEIDRHTARAIYADALKAAQSVGFTFPAEPIRLLPQDKLVAIVRRSQELALEGEGGEAASDETTP